MLHQNTNARSWDVKRIVKQSLKQGIAVVFLVLLHLGLYAEHSNYGKQKRKIIPESGGNLLNGTAGVSLFAPRWTAGVSYQKPLAQNLSGGEVVSKARALVQVAWLF